MPTTETTGSNSPKIVTLDDGRAFSPALQSIVLKLNYAYDTRTGHLDMIGCSDMTACIKLFQRIDPRVCRITTSDNGVPDTAYHLTADGWLADTSAWRGKQ